MKDRFSKQATDYAAFRPTYPGELYDFILSFVKGNQAAWDCATGNGQVARDLAPYFEQVFATDSSAKQIENAFPLPNIRYSVSAAEKTSFSDSTFDLVTVGQAIHWFNIHQFYGEAVRVSKPGGVIAVWGYGLLNINPEVDKVVQDFYVNIIGPYWDAERKLIDLQYSTIPFPFEEIKTPQFSFSFQWTLDELQGYLSTWSSVQKYIIEHGVNPVEALIDRVRPLWNSGKLLINFPLFLRCGRVTK